MIWKAAGIPHILIKHVLLYINLNFVLLCMLMLYVAIVNKTISDTYNTPHGLVCLSL